MQKHILSYITFFGILLLSLGTPQQIFAQTEIEWMTWEEAVEKSKVEKKKIFVDIYTSWCGWCKKMDKTTFKDPVVVNYINKNYYPVKFDAEQTEDITFNEKEYKYVKSGKRGYHELAAWLMRGKMGYPTVVFLDEEFNIIQPIPGFLPSTKFEIIMTYFGGNHYKKTPWQIYNKRYSGQKSQNSKAVKSEEQR